VLKLPSAAETMFKEFEDAVNARFQQT